MSVGRANVKARSMSKRGGSDLHGELYGRGGRSDGASVSMRWLGS